MIAALLMVAAASTTVNYNCKLEPAQSVRFADGAVTTHTITFPDARPSDWNLGVTIKSGGDEQIATVNWANDLFQLNGHHQAIDTSPTSTAFFALAGSGCMFTETAFMTIVHIVGTPKGTRIVITPAALTSDLAAGTREPMNVIVQGSCERIGVAQ